MASVTKRRGVSAPPSLPKPKRSESLAIVDAIVDAALDLGDPDVSMNSIAERAGVGIASLYRYFPTKDALFTEVSRRLQAAFLPRLRAILAVEGVPLRETVRALCVEAVSPSLTPAMRKRLNIDLPAAWTQANAANIFSVAITEIADWLRRRYPNAPADLDARVFVAFSAARGVMVMSKIHPSLAPDEATLLERMVDGSMAYLGLESR